MAYLAGAYTIFFRNVYTPFWKNKRVDSKCHPGTNLGSLCEHILYVAFKKFDYGLLSGWKVTSALQSTLFFCLVFSCKTHTGATGKRKGEGHQDT